ncbi:MAG: phospho-sugar mutase [Bacteroidales bacterium]|uniref:phospho-sugar mutase n=1 Tax=Candidatus Cryptobacteroides sp. TaxID=2952915 RepID=UPI002A759E11|nr:phospho-sugar mutase [Candidatus Cryptobacteroides sp.]MBS7277465.1 phospho-sugar mutase [Bacteroidales bacterium]MDD7235149.1 phospho-sugar mutase [Bacteroidales bacterium]MDD7622846.1 phospho-sugar mutase [Bacteroidales bacterium]MDY2701509.1 phospho-sugar mutase [Candidatus Cryptobacteroides sp.]MDY3879430.1 phospho-sugar mutase [Candidatus Cryptobacteroides sp.]
MMNTMAQDYIAIADSWLAGDFDEETKSKILELKNSDPAGLEDAFYKNLEFGTGGLRGVMGVGTNRMNRYTVGMATQGLANYILKHAEGKDVSVCVSYDSRNNSELFARITADVLSANGLHVYIFDGIRPTPELSYAIRKTGSIAGVMVTASHNPKEYNGYKAYWNDGAQITSPVDAEIIAEVAKVSDPSLVRFTKGEGSGKIELMGSEMDENYMSDILSLMLSPESRARHKDLKIVYTPLHGCGVRLVPECLRRLGFENVYHVAAQDVSDGNFPTVASPNPEEPAAMKMALEEADRQGADLVMATDPDADRMGIAVRDNDGRLVQLNGNQTASIMTYYILTRWKELGKLDSTKYICKTVVTSQLLADIAASFGVKCYNVLTGFKYIGEVVRRNEGKGEFICGGEESYGFNVGEFVRDKDAPVACSVVAECAAWAADQGLTLYQLLQKIYSEYGYRKESLVSLVRKGKSGAEEIQKIMADMRQNPPKEICGSKVVKVIDYLEPEKTGLVKSNVLQFFSEAGDVVSVRPSGTEPKIKFYFGAKGDDADEKLKALRAQFVG